MKALRKAPKYCQGFVDRQGKVRWYYRRPGFPRAPLPGLPWSPGFMAAYAAAEQGERLEIGKDRSAPGTVGALIANYYKSGDYLTLAASTRATYRGIIERFRMEHGDKRVAHLESRHLQKIISDRASTPAAANNLLRMVHQLMRHAVEQGWRRDDPTQGVRKIRRKTGGFPTWEESHIAAFIDHHKPGTRAHLALMLLVCTGQRRSDVVRMGRQHVRNGVLSIIQQKTGQDVHIPLHRDLRALLEALPRDNLTFLVTANGKPYSPGGFTNWFSAMVAEAGLPDRLSAHGLRKATCRRLAEAGCSAHEIMAISGHRSLAEVSRYTQAAGRKDLAKRAIASLDNMNSSCQTDEDCLTNRPASG